MLDLSYAPPAGRGGDIVISTAGAQGLGVPLSAMRAASTAYTAWPAANVALFVPFVVPEPVTVTKLWWANTSTVSGNLDIGLFSENGTLVVSSGSTAMATTNVAQTVDIADTVLARGRWYLGLACDTTAANIYCFTPAAGICQALGVVRQTSAFPLASNANPAVFAVTTHAFIPVCGAQGYRTVGP